LREDIFKLHQGHEIENIARLIQEIGSSFSLSMTTDLGGDSKNFLRKFVQFLVTLGLKIMRLLRLKVVFEADIIKG